MASSFASHSMVSQQLTMPKILCCMCGISIETNPTNMCVSCLHEHVDITQEISKNLTVHSCRSCDRFLGPPWQQVDLESKELMIICLRKIPGLNRLKVVDAVWVWTEPHSMRLKIKLTVQKEVMNGAVVQQSTVVDFMIRNQQCKFCEASFATGAWKAIVQVRQRVDHKRTFYYLEQLILKHDAHADTLKIVTFKDGMDFYFRDRNQGLKFIDFLQTCVPLQMKYSRKLVSADQTNNTADFKHSYILQIAPICKEDLVLLPRSLAMRQSNITPLVLVKKISPTLCMIDPRTGERTEINAEKYFNNPFRSLLSGQGLTRFIILSTEPVLHTINASARQRKRLVVKKKKNVLPLDAMNEEDEEEAHNKKRISQTATQQVSQTQILAECEIAREGDFGVNDTRFTVVTHLGGLLSVGDTVLGYDLTNTNFNADDEQVLQLEKLKGGLPDVILVRKVYGTKRSVGEEEMEANNLSRQRAWQLKRLTKNNEGSSRMDDGKDLDRDEDEEMFLQQIEADREMRAQLNLYRRKREGTATMAALREGDEEEEYEDDEELRLDELLDEMSLNEDVAADDVNDEENDV